MEQTRPGDRSLMAAGEIVGRVLAHCRDAAAQEEMMEVEIYAGDPIWNIGFDETY